MSYKERPVDTFRYFKTNRTEVELLGYVNVPVIYEGERVYKGKRNTQKEEREDPLLRRHRITLYVDSRSELDSEEWCSFNPTTNS